MNRRALICGLGSLVAVLPASGYAQSSPSKRWDVIPEIAVISTESDYRLPAIREAVHFWNAELSKLGSPFRLGSLVHVVVQAIPPGDLRDSADPLAATTRTRVAKILSQIAPTGDVIVLLSDDSNLKPFTQKRPDLQKILVVISNPPPYARIFRGIVRNAAAHEFGHAIGLAHNDDANTLMCGGAQCGFESYSEEFLPITAKEKTTLLEMYPPEWQPKPFRRWVPAPLFLPGGKRGTFGRCLRCRWLVWGKSQGSILPNCFCFGTGGHTQLTPQLNSPRPKDVGGIEAEVEPYFRRIVSFGRFS